VLSLERVDLVEDGLDEFLGQKDHGGAEDTRMYLPMLGV
jgi:hypothetical protein